MSLNNLGEQQGEKVLVFAPRKKNPFQAKILTLARAGEGAIVLLPPPPPYVRPCAFDIFEPLSRSSNQLIMYHVCQR